MHDPDPKYVLGKKIHAGGMKDGEEVIDLLVHNASTAHFISTKLARRFVSDTPPPALVDRMAKTFRESDGDIKAVMHTMIYSPEFWSRETYRAKIKTPFELVVSAARALGKIGDTLADARRTTRPVESPQVIVEVHATVLPRASSPRVSVERRSRRVRVVVTRGRLC